MIKAIIFDMNGIFLQSPPLRERLTKDFGVPADLSKLKVSETLANLRRPNAGRAFDHWQPVLRSWNINFTEQEFWDYWFKAEIPSEKMIRFAKALRGRGIKVFILSNNFKERSEYYGHYPWIHEAVDKVYFSWQTGFVKPDPQAWKLVLSEHDLKPHECIFFDDKEENLGAAEHLGIKSFLFTNEADLEKTIGEYLD